MISSYPWRVEQISHRSGWRKRLKKKIYKEEPHAFLCVDAGRMPAHERHIGISHLLLFSSFHQSATEQQHTKIISFFFGFHFLVCLVYKIWWALSYTARRHDRAMFYIREKYKKRSLCIPVHVFFEDTIALSLKFARHSENATSCGCYIRRCATLMDVPHPENE